VKKGTGKSPRPEVIRKDRSGSGEHGLETLAKRGKIRIGAHYTGLIGAGGRNIFPHTDKAGLKRWGEALSTEGKLSKKKRLKEKKKTQERE